jgi:hypothetical protein
MPRKRKAHKFVELPDKAKLAPSNPVADVLRPTVGDMQFVVAGSPPTVGVTRMEYSLFRRLAWAELKLREIRRAVSGYNTLCPESKRVLELVADALCE